MIFKCLSISAMHILDGDNERLTYKKETAVRDIVQVLNKHYNMTILKILVI